MEKSRYSQVNFDFEPILGHKYSWHQILKVAAIPAEYSVLVFHQHTVIALTQDSERILQRLLLRSEHLYYACGNTKLKSKSWRRRHVRNSKQNKEKRKIYSLRVIVSKRTLLHPADRRPCSQHPSRSQYGGEMTRSALNSVLHIREPKRISSVSSNIGINRLLPFSLFSSIPSRHPC